MNNYKTEQRYYIGNDLVVLDYHDRIFRRKIRHFFNSTQDFGTLSDLSPLNIGYENCPIDNMMDEKTRPYYVIHFIHKGKGYFNDEYGLHAVGANQMFIIKPFSVHSYYPDQNDPWEYSWICFNGKLATAFNSVSSVTDVSFVFYNRIKELTDSENLSSKYNVVAFLFDFIATLSTPVKDKPDYVSLIKSYVEQNYMNDVSVNSIAHSLYISRQYISKVFAEKEGMSIQQYIIKIRLERAVKMLSTGYNVTESAAAVGYCDLFTFSRIFKKKFGVSPSNFIKSLPPTSKKIPFL